MGTIMSFADDHTDFSLALYHELERTGNLFFSPFSVRIALAMALAGARGETAEQMRRALRFESSEAGRALSEMAKWLSPHAHATYELAIANAIWGQDGGLLRNEFRDLIVQVYAGEVNLVDFIRESESVRRRINESVEEKTKTKIRELIPAGGVDARTRLVIVNAVYFKGGWELVFEKDETRHKPF